MQIANDLEKLKNGNQLLKYFMANDEVGVLVGIAEDITTVIVDYQVSLQQETYEQMLDLKVSPIRNHPGMYYMKSSSNPCCTAFRLYITLNFI